MDLVMEWSYSSEFRELKSSSWCGSTDS